MNKLFLDIETIPGQAAAVIGLAAGAYIVIERMRQRVQAVEAEKARVAASAKAEADELAKREANKAHRGRVNRAALAALVAGGITEDAAKTCIELIAKGAIPAVQINY
jgi:colicin import membrane protein